ncbi:MAG: ADP-forming succinate--CoA ligase subunit beta [Candidatus Omnitrophica bacterium]|nr:ADP-forming succinate--CoA ligase subunit beta [Candidatus Omnitrophota bacterium]
MNIHEYQAKELFQRYGIPFHKGIVARTPEEAYKAANELYDPIRQFAVKAMVHAGGRGKGGGIKMTADANEVKAFTAKILGKQLVTPQTGPEGKPVDCVLIESTSEIGIEYYASIVLDRSVYKLCLIVSRQGGMDIEEVAHKEPEKIIKQHFELEGLTHADALNAALKLNPDPKIADTLANVFQAMAKLFVEQDCSLIEINPLALMKNGRIIAIDAKINLDDNALYRHPETAGWYDPAQEDPREVDARKIDLSYVGLDGNIGCIVNGAGLAMATMDIIKYAGGEAANFLDVGGGANKEKVTAAFKILLRDARVKAILVNIFGGIMRCDVVAEGILAAIEDLEKSGLQVSKIPLVVRLEGTNVEKGREILERSNLKIMTATSFEEAARKVVGAIA